MVIPCDVFPASGMAPWPPLPCPGLPRSYPAVRCPLPADPALGVAVAVAVGPAKLTAHFSWLAADPSDPSACPRPMPRHFIVRAAHRTAQPRTKREKVESAAANKSLLP